MHILSKDTKRVFALALPAALKHLADILQVLVDMIMVGYVSVHALAAVGLSMQFMMFINVLMNNLLYNALSAAGDTKSSLFIKLASSGIISYGFNVAIYLLLLLKHSEAKLRFIPIIRFNDIKRALKIGYHAAIDRGISTLSFLVFVAIITYYGTVELAGYQVGLRIEGLAFMPGFGFAIAAMALVGQALGALHLFIRQLFAVPAIQKRLCVSI